MRYCPFSPFSGNPSPDDKRSRQIGVFWPPASSNRGTLFPLVGASWVSDPCRDFFLAFAPSQFPPCNSKNSPPLKGRCLSYCVSIVPVPLCFFFLLVNHQAFFIRRELVWSLRCCFPHVGFSFRSPLDAGTPFCLMVLLLELRSEDVPFPNLGEKNAFSVNGIYSQLT